MSNRTLEPLDSWHDVHDPPTVDDTSMRQGLEKFPNAGDSSYQLGIKYRKQVVSMEEFVK